MPEPDGLSVDDVEAVLADVARRRPVAGIGVTGLVPDDANAPVASRLLTAAGF